MPSRRLFLFLLSFSFVLSNSTAWAELRVCNDTQSIIAVALGQQDKHEWSTSGWWQIAAMSCVPLIKTKLKSRYYYLYAEEAKNEGRWEGPIFLCVKDQKFDIKGIGNCYVRGYQKAGFQELDTLNNTSWTVHLTDENRTNNLPQAEKQ